MTYFSFWRAAGRNGGWLWVPPLAISFAFWPHLGPAFQPEIFWRDIPEPLGLAENTLRFILVGLSFGLQTGLSRSRQRTGLAVYLVGLGLYMASQALIAANPQSAWSTSAIGFLAPAYTPLIWLVGIGMISERWLVPQIGRSSLFYIGFSAAFIATHVSHAALVYSRGI